MTRITTELWPGHVLTVIIVRRWVGVYRLFNRVFARATWRHEYAILPSSSQIVKLFA